jgi:hypothetical protein
LAWGFKLGFGLGALVWASGFNLGVGKLTMVVRSMVGMVYRLGNGDGVRKNDWAGGEVLGRTSVLAKGRDHMWSASWKGVTEQGSLSGACHD